ncbi:ABC transporter substrate-binding protein [Hydrogenophaga sp.]|uniref:ABC transporter substrate-binding protein n=1 Tax=Hydrogenophaga sp. TaxID=1904254 RepID=UPI002FC952BE
MPPISTLPNHTAHLSRRTCVAGLLASPFVLTARAATPSRTTIRIGQTTALSGPLGDLGLAMHNGAKACFTGVNARGGIQGIPIELIVKDDGYDATRALDNAVELINDPQMFALFNCMGTPMTAAILPKVKDSGIPLFAPFTGALSVRPKDMRNVFYIRPSYPDEGEQLVQHLDTIGTRRISVAYQNNSFGKEIYEGVRLAMERRKMTAPRTVTVETDSSNVAEAAASIAAHPPEALLVGIAGKPAVDFIRAFRRQRKAVALYSLSILGTAQTLRDLGPDGVGIALSQVVPMPGNSNTPVVREFQLAWKALGVAQEPSHLALEGFINAKAFVLAMQRAGKDATREAFINSTWKLGRQDLGGFDLRFTAPGIHASRFIELTMVGQGGRFIR